MLRKRQVNELSSSEECSICLNKMTKEEDIRTLDCGHKFHKKCINEALKYKRQCPYCRTPIDYNERILSPVPYGSSRNDIMNIALRPPLINEDFEYEITKFAEDNTAKIIQREEEGPSQFLGVIVFYRDGINRLKHLKTYFNTDLGLTSKSNRDQLKYAILSKAPELAIECPRLTIPRISATKNYLNKSAGVEVFSDNPTFTINKMYFGTPAGIQENGYAIRDYPSDIHADMPYSFRKVDMRVYRPGHFIPPERIETQVEIQDIQFHIFQNLKDAYKKYMRKAKSQVMYGSEYGLEFSALNDVLDGDPPIAWIIVELGCGYYKNTNSTHIGTIHGGKKTRRNKSQRKRNKSQRKKRL